MSRLRAELGAVAATTSVGIARVVVAEMAVASSPSSGDDMGGGDTFGGDGDIDGGSRRGDH